MKNSNPDTLEAKIREYCQYKYKKQPRENYRFNRLEIAFRHFYIEEFATKPIKHNFYVGFIKCKLAHSNRGSVIVPDQVYLRGKSLLWIQPLAFSPNLIISTKNQSICTLYVEIALGNTLKITFKNSDFIRHFDDSSSLFKCQIYGPKDLKKYATGKAEITEEKLIYLQLFHHTNEVFKERIIKSSYLKASQWNIQGNKILKNVNYIYFTCLDKIKTDDDLKKIAMASDGELLLAVDNSEFPKPLPLNWKQKTYKNDILKLEIYRQSTYDRSATLKFSVDASTLAPSHVIQHFPNGEAVYYEICNPYIYRIGVLPNEVLYFTKNKLHNDRNKLKKFNYMVLGDARRLEGLAAPYNEEETTQIFKIETISENLTVFEFWFQNGNQDLYSGKKIEFQQFTEY